MRVQRLRSRRGQSAVELALVMPLLFVVLFGAIEFGTAMYDKAVVTNASREGARAAIVGTTPRLSNAGIDAVVQNYAANNLFNFKQSNTVTTTVNPTLVASRTSGTTVTVTATYTYSFFLVPKFLTAFTGSLSLNGATTMRME